MQITRSRLGVLLVVASGCPSTTAYRTAEPVEPGRWQLGAAVGAGVLRDREQDTRIPTGHLELSARRGIADDVDVGVKLYTFGSELNATVRAYRGRLWSWALLPAISGLRARETAVTVDAIHLFAQLGMVASRPLSRRWSFGVGGQVGWGLYLPATGGSAQGAWLGGFAVFDARLGLRWHFTPELGLYRVLAGEVPVRGAAVNAGAAFRRDL